MLTSPDSPNTSNLERHPTWNFKKLMLEEIAKNGGWVNSHVHADRAFTMNPNKLDIYRNHSLYEKWDIVDEVKQNATIDDYYSRCCNAFEVMIENGVSVIGSFVDVDPVSEDRAILGAIKAREKYKDQLTIKFINQTLKGVFEPKAKYWFEKGADMCDIIGGLPRRDERDFGPGYGSKHIDLLLKTGKKLNKLVHIHVDQFNEVEDTETELVADKTIEHDMQNKVVAIHSISVAAHTKEYRQKVYAKMKEAGLMVIACPTAWIDSPRKEAMSPGHNALTPIDEMIPNGITVAIGTDNICDYMVPFCDGEMWPELRLLAVGNRYVEIDELVKIATTNGRKVLGVD